MTNYAIKKIFIESMNPSQIEYNQLVEILCNNALDNLVKKYLNYKELASPEGAMSYEKVMNIRKIYLIK